MKTTGATRSAFLKAGDWVEVRSEEEILATLDEAGCLENLPFMPEMLQYCGKRFRVFKRAHKACDTAGDYRSRRIFNAVHLNDSRCDGSAHDGCQAECLLYWKEAWLRRVDSLDPDSPEEKPTESEARVSDHLRASLEAQIRAATALKGTEGERVYRCQATELPRATQPWPWWDIRQYVEDLCSGNVGLARQLWAALFSLYDHVVNLGIGVGPAMRWIYDRVATLLGACPYPSIIGRLPAAARTPSQRLDLQPGEWVRVKNHKAILETLTVEGKNKGLRFDAEMVPYCGRVFQVRARVERIIDERTGRMLEFKTDCIILNTVVCQALYSRNRLFCPRSIYPFWREIWLERINPPGSD